MSSDLSEKLIINVALTGMVPRRADTAHVPISPDEIADDVVRCYNAGASIFHLHARDENEEPTYRVDAYREIFRQVRSRCQDDLILCVTTSGRIHKTFAQRSEVLELRDPVTPDMASLTLGSMNFPKQASVNSPEMIVQLATKMYQYGIMPELEVFEPGMIEYSHYLLRKQILRSPSYYNLLLGSLGTTGATPANLVNMVRLLPTGATWAATGIGTFQFGVNALAITMGGHVRVGLEDSIYLDAEKKTLATNVALVERLVGVAKAVGREPATPAEAREMIGLPLPRTRSMRSELASSRSM